MPSTRFHRPSFTSLPARLSHGLLSCCLLSDSTLECCNGCILLDLLHSPEPPEKEPAVLEAPEAIGGQTAPQHRPNNVKDTRDRVLGECVKGGNPPGKAPVGREDGDGDAAPDAEEHVDGKVEEEPPVPEIALILCRIVDRTIPGPH